MLILKATKHQILSLEDIFLEKPQTIKLTPSLFRVNFSLSWTCFDVLTPMMIWTLPQNIP